MNFVSVPVRQKTALVSFYFPSSQMDNNADQSESPRHIIDRGWSIAMLTFSPLMPV